MPAVAAEQPPPAILGDLDAIAHLPGAGERYLDLAAFLGAIADGAPAPKVVLASTVAGSDGEDLALAARTSVQHTLALLQEWLAADALVDTRLVLLTSGAVAIDEGEAPDLIGASVWGLVRSAQSEHPGRFLIIDLDPASPPPQNPTKTDHDRDTEQIDWRCCSPPMNPKLPSGTTETRTTAGGA